MPVMEHIIHISFHLQLKKFQVESWYCAPCFATGKESPIDARDLMAESIAARIKTIVVVAVVPHGVVQLGSTHLIMENLELVDHIKNLFAILQNVPAAFRSNSVKDSVIGMIKGPFLQAVPLLPRSAGRSPTLEGKPVASLTATGQFIWPFPMNESSIMLAKSNGPFVA